MPIFQYKALREDGESAGGIIAAESPREAREKLRSRRLHPTSMTILGGREEKRRTVLLARYLRPRPSPEHLSTFTRELATLIDAGIPLADALAPLAQQFPHRRLQSVILDLRQRIMRGDSFSAALAAHPEWFDELYVSVIGAAEASGGLDEALKRLAGYVGRRERLRSRIAAALAYPVVMISISFCVLVFLLSYVVPRIVALFKDRSLLPLPTRVLVGVSGVIRSYWFLIVGAAFLAYVLFRAFVATEKGRRWRDGLVLRVPILGEIARRAGIARFAVTLAGLVRSGIPVHEALLIVKDVIGNQVLADAVEEIHARVLEGAEISTPMSDAAVFPPTVAQMVAVGERSGRLPELLDRVAEAYEEYVEVNTQKLTSLLEPVIIVLMAFFVAYIVLSVLLPVLRIGLAVGA